MLACFSCKKKVEIPCKFSSGIISKNFNIDSLGYYELTKELKDIRRLDQKYRNGDVQNERFVRLQPNLDEHNRIKLDSLYAIYGFPSIEKVGFRGYDVAWLVLHHSSDCQWNSKWLGRFLDDWSSNGSGDFNSLMITVRRHYQVGKGRCPYEDINKLAKCFPGLVDNLRQAVEIE